MKKVINLDLVIAKLFLVSLLILMTVTGCFSQTPVAANGALRVSGNKIVNKNNQAVSFSGPSYFWSNTGWGAERFYNASVVNYFRSNWNAGIIRAAMGVADIDGPGGYLSDASNKTRVKTVVDAATSAGMYVIIDWHTHHAENYRQDAINFFKEMAQTYGTRDNVIYEIYNEPLNVSWSGTIKPYAQAVISAIRSIDPDNIIIVGTPNWSQDVDVAATDPITGYNNIAYTLHFYAATHKAGLRSKASTALSKGLALFVTEWGTCEASGTGFVDQSSTNEWVSFMKANEISNCNWSINDKAESASILNGGVSSNGAWSDSDLTTSGKIVKSIVSGWGGGPNQCTVANLPSTIQAESYCSMSGIQTENTTDAGGGQNVGWIDAGDWLSYSINAPSSGTYTVQYRIASMSGGGTIKLEKQGGSVSYGTIAVPSTGGWQNWQTITQTIQLPAGQQNIAIAAVGGGFNLNWFSMTGGSGGFSQTIQAESYAVMSGVQTEATSDNGGGSNVGWIDTNDWMKYAGISIPSMGLYVFEYRIASPNSTGILSQDLNAGAIQLGTINIPNTGGWQNWQTISRAVTLNAGTYDFGIFAKAGGWNINWWKISSAAGGRIASSESTEVNENALTVYPNPSSGLINIRVTKPSQVTVMDNTGKSHYNAHVDEQVTLDQLKPGFYIIRMQHQSGSATQKLIVR
jgi:endoglucanase